MSQINIMYGKNGRGKSTVAQSLMLLSQTMSTNNGINELHLMGKLVELGVYDDVISHYEDGSKTFSFKLDTESENVEMGFSPCAEKPQMAQINKLIVNGTNRFDVITDDANDSASVSVHAVGTTSDIMVLQSLKQLQYVSAARLGPRNFSSRIDSLDSSWYGVKGEYVINVLANKGEDFRNKVCAVLSNVLSGATLRTSSKDDERIELFLDSVNNGKSFRPVNVGFGYSFVLTVIVAALLAPKNSILIIENPEAHLHPGAQSRLTKFLIEISKQNNIQLLVETHSDHVVNGLRIAMKQGLCDLTPEDAQIVFFYHSDTETMPAVDIIKCDKFGELSAYPEDFLDEWTKQLLDLV